MPEIDETIIEEKPRTLDDIRSDFKRSGMANIWLSDVAYLLDIIDKQAKRIAVRKQVGKMMEGDK